MFSQKIFVAYNCFHGEQRCCEDEGELECYQKVVQNEHLWWEKFLSCILKLRTMKNYSHFEKTISCIWPAAVTLKAGDNSNLGQFTSLWNYYLHAAAERESSTPAKRSAWRITAKIAINSTDRFWSTAINYISGNFRFLGQSECFALLRCSTLYGRCVGISSGTKPLGADPREEAWRHVPPGQLCTSAWPGAGWIWIFRPWEIRRERNHASAWSSCARVPEISRCRSVAQPPWRKVWRFKGNTPLLWNCVNCPKC